MQQNATGFAPQPTRGTYSILANPLAGFTAMGRGREGTGRGRKERSARSDGNGREGKLEQATDWLRLALFVCHCCLSVFHS